MAGGLLNYYERELAYFRQMGAEFAGKYPKIASRLLLEPDNIKIPEVKRCIWPHIPVQPSLVSPLVKMVDAQATEEW